jgi:tRNA(His) guanylyltransferase
MDSFSESHGFEKPNDERALKLMDHAACAVMSEYPDIILAYGESDEYRYVRACVRAYQEQCANKFA